jgi:hypothetical protein
MLSLAACGLGLSTRYWMQKAAPYTIIFPALLWYAIKTLIA